MLNAQNGISKLSCSVSTKFSTKFVQEFSWQKVDKTGAVVDDEDDITEGNENVNPNPQNPTTNSGDEMEP